MRWKRGRGRGQIEDRRGARRSGGMGLPLPLPIGGKGGLGGLGLLVVLVVVLLSSGVLGGGGGTPQTAPSERPAEEERLADFVAFVVDDVQDSWARAFAEDGREYEPTTLVLFEQATTSGCGPASAATGPFYCPRDRKVYLDLGFFRELATRFGASGDFAQAYVIAHEFGHHVQNVTGIAGDVRRVQSEDPARANELSVKLELQADCLAGVWASSAAEEDLLEPGDLEEGLAAAAAVGDDRIQREAGGRVERETWTHGSSRQRATWFRRGFESGDTQACNTFADG